MFYVEFNANLRRVFLGLTVLLAVIIVVKSLTPALPSLAISNIDKLAHMSAYLALGAVTLPAFSHVKPFIVWCGLCAFGASIEIAQGLLSTGRSADIMDGVANASGAVLAVVGWMILTRFAQKIT